MTTSKIVEAARELTRRRADLVAHGHASFAQHLSGVQAVLERWRQPERVQLAGLFHAAYATEAFHVALFRRSERARVRELLGEDAERLVLAFSGCPRDVLLAAAERDGGRVEVALRWGGAVALDRRDLADLATLHAANLAEQSTGARGGPGRWLAAASRWLAAARDDREIAPPVLEGGARVIAPAEEAALLRGHRALLRTLSPRLSSAGAMPEAVSASPVGEPFVIAGLVALASGRAREARALGERALAAFDAWGTAWDKRLALPRWRELAELLVRDGKARGDELEAARRRAEIVAEGARGSPARLWAQLDALRAFEATAQGSRGLATDAPRAVAGGGLPPRFAEYMAGLRGNAEHPMLAFYPGLRAEPWHDPSAFPIVAELERLAPRIAEEVRALDPASFQDEAEDIDRAGRWSILFLLEMGRRNERLLAGCPTLRSLVEGRGALSSHAGSMYLSCLDPRTRVAAHQGPTNLRVRCHLGLDVPGGEGAGGAAACGIRVGGVPSTWQEGRCIVFDDSFPHEVWNDTDRRRVVLVVDLWHPDLEADEIALLAGLHRYGAAVGGTLRGYWARNDAARGRAVQPAAATAREKEPFASLRRAVAESPGDASLHLRLGHELARAERWVEAEASARAALAIDPSHAMAHNNLGWVRQKQGDTKGAVAAYERALALDPACRRARRNLASLLASLGRASEAFTLRRDEAREAPDDPAAIGAAIGAAMSAGELEAAAAYAARHAALVRGTRWYPVARSDDPPRPAGVAWSQTLTPSKLLHDIEQLEHLTRRGIVGDELGPVIEAYDGMLDTLRPLGQDARVPLVGAARDAIGHVYNRLVHVRPTPRVARALSSAWDRRSVEEELTGKRPGLVVVDDFLTKEALESLRLFCLESTVWSENLYNHGRLGSMFQDGFNCPLLIQLAEEIREALPRIFPPSLPVRQIWGYKYASSAPEETPHADFSEVNVNVWITPEQANLDPSTGGLLVWDVAAPRDWDFATYNSNAGVKIRAYLAERRAKPRHIAYKANRAMIFDSALFHATPAISFRPGYENRRVNVTVLFGSRQRAEGVGRAAP